MPTESPSPHTLPDSLIAALRALVGDDNLLDDSADLAFYGNDRTTVFSPRPALVVLPRSTAEVRAVVQLANEHQLAIVPSGGRTGLSGGAVAMRGELVLSLEKMRAIQDFDPVDLSVRCQAGVVLAELKAFAEQQGLMYPVDLASSGSCQIGGNVSTNAGGINVLRYGGTREQILGLQVVTGRGEILELNRGLIKNNAGYDLRHLFIAAEGTLGVITEVTVRLLPAPPPLAVYVMSVNNIKALPQILGAFRQRLRLRAFEFFTAAAMDKVLAAGVPAPGLEDSPYYVLLEYEEEHEQSAALALQVFEHCVAQAWVNDAVVSQSEQQRKNLWRLREQISETLSAWKPFKSDLATRVSQLPAMILALEAKLQQLRPDWELVWFGHVGDGNVHLNILKPEQLSVEDFFADCRGLIAQVYALIEDFGGSISAEHGIGLLKKDYLHNNVSAAEIELMRGIKAVFDPRGIMNPGKIFDC